MKPVVGVNYFSGWWREEPNKWKDAKEPSKDWRERYVNRISLNGCYDDQMTMDSDILTAAQYGVDFFQMLWYPVDSASTQCDGLHAKYLNAGIAHFCASPYNDKMRFVVEYCNHPPFSILEEGEWEKTCRLWAGFLKHPSYYTVDGKAIFKIHSFPMFREQCGNDLSVVRERIRLLKRIAREEAGRELLLTGGITYGDVGKELLRYLKLVDFYSVYMDLPQLPSKDRDYEYGLLLDYALSFAEKCAGLGIPFMPYFPSGWNPRPWYDPRPSFRIPDGEQIRKGILRLCGLIRQNPLLGIPAGDGRREAFSIYAWNEFGEGGYLAPTLVEYDDKLQGLKRALELIA